MEDARERSDMGGARVKGEDHGESKLTEKQVIAIREQYATGHWTQKELANSFDIARAQKGSIVRGENLENAGGPITEIGERNQWQMPNSTGENPDKQGENHHNSSLTEEDVIEIREKYHNQGVYQKDLAEEHGVARSNIGQIVRGDSWESAGGPTR
jgi:DNA-binding XRE family transcriptional regulator